MSELKCRSAATTETVARAAAALVVAQEVTAAVVVATGVPEAAIVAGEIAVADINPQLLDKEMSLAELPRPDLCIRTGGDHRISNFMLWQFAYSELYFTETLWPDFGEAELALAIEDFSGRERRFGLRDEGSN